MVKTWLAETSRSTNRLETPPIQNSPSGGAEHKLNRASFNLKMYTCMRMWYWREWGYLASLAVFWSPSAAMTTRTVYSQIGLTAKDTTFRVTFEVPVWQYFSYPPHPDNLFEALSFKTTGFPLIDYAFIKPMIDCAWIYHSRSVDVLWI